jgi:hypothetical protein
MLITSKQLRNVIARALHEAPMREPEELPRFNRVVFYREWTTGIGDFMEVAYYDRSQLHRYNPGDSHVMDPSGSEPIGRITVIRRKRRSNLPPCDGAWTVDLTEQTRKGWGPLLYQVAIELATLRGGKGLMPDRYEVSDEAASVWQKFLAGASDGVQSHQLDSEWNTLTDDPEDNCDHDHVLNTQDPDLKHRLVHLKTPPSAEDAARLNDIILSSALSKRYTRPPITLQRLIEQGSLYDLHAKSAGPSIAFKISNIEDLAE